MKLFSNLFRTLVVLACVASLSAADPPRVSGEPVIKYVAGLGLNTTISNSLSVTGALASFRMRYDNSSATKTNFSITHNGNETFMVLSTSNTWAWLDQLNGLNLMSHVASSAVMSMYGGLMNFSGGNVGIGTNAPLSPLHLVGGNFVIGPAGEIEFQDVATGGTRRRVIALENQHLWLGNETNLATTALLAHDTIDPESFAGTLTFYGHALSPSVSGIRLGHGVPFGGLRLRNKIGATTKPLEVTSTNTATQFLVDTNGNVGIGTNAPNATLEVNGSVRLRNLGASNASPVAAAVFDANGLLTHGALGAAGVSSGIFQDGTTNLVDSGSSGKFITRNNSGSISGVYTNVYEFGNDLSASDTRLSFWEALAVDSISFGASAWEHTAEEMQKVYTYTNTASIDLFQFWKPVEVNGDLTVNGGLSVTTFHTDALNILSNRLAVADAANHQFDLSLPWKELEYTNSMTQGTRIAITNAASTNFSALRVEVEGAASGGSNFAITNTFPSGDLAQLNGAALAVSITDTVTNGMKIEDSWQKTWKRGTNIWVGYRTYNAR